VFQHGGRGTALVHHNAQGTRPIDQHGVEVRAPDLEPLPWYAGIIAEGLKPAWASPFDPQSRVAHAGDFRQASRNAKQSEQRLYPRMQGFAWAVAARRLALA